MLVLAHRGYHAEFPENSMAAFAAAVALGCDGIETDVRMTRDGVPVLSHSGQAGNGLPIGSVTRRELDETLGYSLPTLDEALLHWPGIFWNAEIKAPSRLSQIVEVLRPYQASHRLVVSSFDHTLAAGIARYLAVDCALVFVNRPADMKSFLARWAGFPRLRTVVSEYKFFDIPMLEEVRAAGFRIFVYGVITPAEHAECAALGVDGLITDYPDRVSRNRPP